MHQITKLDRGSSRLEYLSDDQGRVIKPPEAPRIVLCTADPLKHYTGMGLLVRPVRRQKIKPWRYLECSFCFGDNGRELWGGGGEVADRTTGKDGAGET